jgi:hypothetical protein
LIKSLECCSINCFHTFTQLSVYAMLAWISFILFFIKKQKITKHTLSVTKKKKHLLSEPLSKIKFLIKLLYNLCLIHAWQGWNTRVSPNVVCYGNFWLFILHICIHVCRDIHFSRWWLFTNIQSFDWGKNKTNILDFFLILDYFTAFNFLLEKKQTFD